jgi:hypothetical protein
VRISLRAKASSTWLACFAGADATVPPPAPDPRSRTIRKCANIRYQLNCWVVVAQVKAGSLRV